ncbi:DUF6497 family protein [Poseidonocella sedimentorum]|uniref:Uncharacterized protein n=1 Tax=Poseidonocella sedimentorum TaxID=871652 RepID=A0A1I6CT62_9RHOB|nr:DUF6497 family protein [Poseidonocella sedimentorum]SFQ96292.1 hypothetical protein SAMN04515673_101316 [Poseidonocella sedimentorum]
MMLAHEFSHWRYGFAAIGGILWGMAATADGEEEALAVPSGQFLQVSEVIDEPLPSGGLRSRWRFVAPGMTSTTFARLEPDFAHLCEHLALPALRARGLRPTEIVISIADRDVVFGVSDPEAVQFFEAFRVEGGRCQWSFY